MRRLILFRHAKAEPHGIRPDHERNLARRGQEDAVRMGERLARGGLRPDAVIVSTSERTRQTWALAAPALGGPPATEDWQIYEASAERLLEVVHGGEEAAHTLLLVGHNPGFEELVTLLVDREGSRLWKRLGRTMPTAAVAVLEAELATWRDVRPARMRFAGLLAPRDEDR